MKRRLKPLALAAGLAVSALPAWAGNHLAVALSGFDTVSYHDGAPMQGEVRYSQSILARSGISPLPKTATSSPPIRTAMPPPMMAIAPRSAASQSYKAPGNPGVREVVDGTLYVQIPPRAEIKAGRHPDPHCRRQ